MRRLLLAATAACAISTVAAAAEGDPDKLLWGDTHLHTNLSSDAYFLGNKSATAETSYRFARGEPVIHPYHRARVQLHTPLDFLAVSDHGELLGVPYRLMTLGDDRLTNTRLGAKLIQLVKEGRSEDAFGLFIVAITVGGEQGSMQRPPKVGAATALWWRLKSLISVVDRQQMVGRWLAGDPTLLGDLDQPEVIRTSWESNLAAAEKYNEPGKFTTLVAWEFTPTPDGANLHRIVLSNTDGVTAKQFLPYTANDSDNPEDLWRWLEETSKQINADFVAIPHNSNISKGRMFSTADFHGKPMTKEIAQLRANWETVAEVTQIKGTSETHPLLSPNDEFAGFEFFNRLIEARPGAQTTPTVTDGDYIRSALRNGLKFEETLGVNPFKLGMIGSTDSHTGLSSAEENNFMGKMGIDSIPENKETGFGRVSGWEMSASGLAAVWARENTREEIVAAFRRREVYGTTGPHMSVRFFGGFDFAPGDADARDIAATGYAKGVPMGGDLKGSESGRAPSFLVRAVKDPIDANLDRVQIVKGWLDASGETHEKVFDVAWSGGRLRDAQGRLAPVGDTVDHKTASYTNTIGAPELAAVWTDPEFDAKTRAFYYVRVLQIPTPRDSLYDSVALQKAPPEGYAEVIQERAYTSPIWYTP
ncbi:MAG TPA: DUF3604 domain-containing protein [Parvularculaceae bacterium]|nr:DUF3604 domain-containing protein [Caulobacterales bacterium]HPE32010.1 DUF3604 domain-containing protein [Parvularculaceae bacterium]